MKILLQFRLILLCMVVQVAAYPVASYGAETESASTDKLSRISEVLDSLFTTTYFQDERFTSSQAAKGADAYPKEFIPQFTDSVYASRIAALDRKSDFNLVYNQHVKGYIRVYAVDRRKFMTKVLGLTSIYFPLFEEKLREYDIPDEMKYLAIVESALNPTAVSRAGARGLWQFMSGTGKMYGLRSTSFIEDRYDPYKSTVAACEHMRDLYDMFGDWFLVLAAYNAGAGSVQRAIRASGGAHDYWEIWPYLPQETRGYVPAFIAVSYVMSYYREHNIRPAQPGYIYSETGRVPVREAVTFEQLNETIGVPLADLRFLNPQYKADLIPAPESTPHMLRLPKSYLLQFQKKEPEIYAYRPDLIAEKERLYAMVREADKQDAVVQSGRGRKEHVVKKGETLSRIARKYGTSVSKIIEWNKLKRSSLSPGQKLTIFNADKSTGRSKSSSAKIKAKKKLKSKATKASAKNKAVKKAKKRGTGKKKR